MIDANEGTKLRLLLRLAWPYDPGNEIGILVQYAYRDDPDLSVALNARRREEILR